MQASTPQTSSLSPSLAHPPLSPSLAGTFDSTQRFNPKLACRAFYELGRDNKVVVALFKPIGLQSPWRNNIARVSLHSHLLPPPTGGVSTGHGRRAG